MSESTHRLDYMPDMCVPSSAICLFQKQLSSLQLTSELLNLSHTFAKAAKTGYNRSALATSGIRRAAIEEIPS